MKYAGIINNDVVNGYDVCVSYWCQGCHFRCPGCHNPQTWDFDGGYDADENELINKIIESISENGIQRNLSILGGEPLCNENIDFTYRLVNEVKERYPNIKIFCWTGYKYEDLVSFCDASLTYTGKKLDIAYKLSMILLLYVDVLIDGKFDINNRDITLPFRGSKNQRVIDLKKSFANNCKAVLWEEE